MKPTFRTSILFALVTFLVGCQTKTGSAPPVEKIKTEIGTALEKTPPESQIKLLRDAYAAFNSRDIDAALATMTPDVAWPKAFKGGFVRGPGEIRAYWTEQWSEINPNVDPLEFHSEENGNILVKVHQVVRDLEGTVLADVHVGHRFTIANNLIEKMEISPLDESGN